MDIKAGDVKELRDKTGAGMMDAKQALVEANGSVDRAIELLRKKGQKIAAKKSDRDASEGLIGMYLHANGRVAAMVSLNCETDFVARTDQFKELANNLAMQVAAMNPKYLSPDNVPEEEKNKEKDIYREEMKDSDKPANIIEKIIEGKLEKYYAGTCLLRQSYIKEDSLTIEKLLTASIAKIGENIKINKFVRYSL